MDRVGVKVSVGWSDEAQDQGRKRKCAGDYRDRDRSRGGDCVRIRRRLSRVSERGLETRAPLLYVARPLTCGLLFKIYRDLAVTSPGVHFRRFHCIISVHDIIKFKTAF